MPLFGIEPAGCIFGVILLDVTGMSQIQQFVAVVHLDGQRMQGLDDLGIIGDDGLVVVSRQFGQVMLFDGRVNAELYHLGVDHDKLELSGMFFVQQGGYQRIQPHRFTLPGSSRYQNMRHFAKVKHEHFVHDGFTQHHGQIVFGFLKFARLYQTEH